MESGSLRVIRAVPGGASLAALVTSFCRRDEGYVTSFSEPLLATIREYVEEDSLVEVLSFPKLVQNALGMTGEVAGELTMGQHLQSAVSHACAQMEASEDPFAASRNLPGARVALGDTLRELLDHGIDANEMRRLSYLVPPRLSAKLRSLAELSDRVGDVLRRLGRERHTDHLKKCLGAVPDWDGYGHRMLVFAGSDFAPLRIEWLKWAAQHGMEVQVVVDRHASDGELFDGAGRIVQALGVPAEELGDGNVLVRNLFAESQLSGPEADVELAVAPDPLAESEWALRRAAEDGNDNLTLYVRNLASYAPLLEAASRRLGIPVCIQRREKLMANAFAALVSEVLQALGETGVRGMSRLAARSHLGLAAGRRRAFLKLLDAASTSSEPWPELARRAEEAGPEWTWLLKLVAWRTENVPGERTISEWSELLTALVHDLPWHEPLHGGQSEARMRDERAMHVLKSTVMSEASIRRAMDGGAVGYAAFVRLCVELWENSDVSVPAKGEGVRVVNSSEGLTDAATVVALGMLEGSFPRRRSEDPVLEDAERWAINEARAGEPSLPDSFAKARKERDEFYRLACFARRRLVLSYPSTNDERDNVPAFYIEMARAAAGGMRETVYPRSLVAPAASDCRYASDARLRASLDGPRDALPEITVESSEAAEVLKPKEGETHRPEDLRDAFRCAFLFNARHRLKLRPTAGRARWYALRALPASVGLASLPDAGSARSALLGALRSELDNLRPFVEDWEMRALESGGHRMIRDFVRNEFNAREAWPREAVETNVPFGEKGVRGDVMGLKLEGTIPAVSEIGGYRVAHLYTGGPGKAELTEEQKLLYGVYAMSLVRNHSDWPALEFDKGSGTREIVFFGDTPAATNGPKREGLARFALAQQLSGEAFFEVFRKELKVLLQRALANIREGRVAPQPGEHCDQCGYGELCRRHRGFSDEAGFDVL
ncbi:hypothetical protein EON79_07410 [bacterium]|nr:MAG: hypothetical protein EON79_07410 [bacterium]